MNGRVCVLFGKGGMPVANAFYEKRDREYTLVSYTTPVCKAKYAERDGVGKVSFIRIGRGPRCDSVTTMRHVNAFRELFGLAKISKAAWNAM